MNKVTKILLAGEGGQGVQSVAEILAEAANIEGQESLYMPNFGTEQRGGVSVAFVQVSPEKKIGSPKFLHADIVVALSDRAVNRILNYVGKDTIFIYDNSIIDPAVVEPEAIGLQAVETRMPETAANPTGGDQPGLHHEKRKPIPKCKKILGIPATEVAKTELHPRVFNIIILGTVVGITQVVSEESLEKALEHKFGSKFKERPQLRELNFRALEQGLAFAKESE